MRRAAGGVASWHAPGSLRATLRAGGQRAALGRRAASVAEIEACDSSVAPKAASSTRTIAARTTPTNVLSFPAPLQMATREATQPLGDLVICPPGAARRSARAAQDDCARTGRTSSCTARCISSGYDHERDARRASHGAPRDRACCGAWVSPIPIRSCVLKEGGKVIRMSKDLNATGRWLRKISADPSASPRTADDLVAMPACRRRAWRASTTTPCTMLEGVLRSGGPAGARHHGAAGADDLRAPRRSAGAPRARRSWSPATRASR